MVVDADDVALRAAAAGEGRRVASFRVTALRPGAVNVTPASADPGRTATHLAQYFMLLSLLFARTGVGSILMTGGTKL
jgi:hypothetical protein